MVFITGDIHGNPQNRFSLENFPQQNELCKKDLVIIIGDFGLVWDYKGENTYEKERLDWLEQKTFTTCFVDGNHENFDRLVNYPTEIWNGGKVHKIRSSIIHLMRGQIFQIQEKRFFTFGGARSHDIRDGIIEVNDPKLQTWKNNPNKLFRVNKISWWKQELPSQEEMNEALNNLQQTNNNVDFILTHCGASSSVMLLSRGYFKPDILTDYLEDIRSNVNFKRWFFGHYHIDTTINEQETAIFEKILRII